MNEIDKSPHDGKNEKEHIAVAIYEGELKFTDDAPPLKVAVLEDGTRLISRNAILRAFGRTVRGRSKGEYRAENLPSFADAKNLRPFLSDELYHNLTNPIRCKTLGGEERTHIITGYKAQTLPLLCDAYLEADKQGKLQPRQKPLAEMALGIVRALSKIGIIALIDEATGYQKDKNRAKDELQKFLKQFMREEAAKWVKRFEDSFFEMIYKMRGWTWNYTHRHPGVVGVWINDIVYERIAPLVLNELRAKNPVKETGGRKNKHYVFLSEEVGIPRLLNHLAAVEALGRASGYNWNRFMGMLDKAFPKQYQQLSLIFDEPADTPPSPAPEPTSFDAKLVKALNYNPKEK